MLALGGSSVRVRGLIGGLASLSGTHTAHDLSALVDDSDGLSESDGHGDVLGRCVPAAAAQRAARGVLCDLEAALR